MADISSSMKKTGFKLHPKCSVPIGALLNRQQSELRPSAGSLAMGFAAGSHERFDDADRVDIVVEADDLKTVEEALGTLQPGESFDHLSSDKISARIGLDRIARLADEPRVRRILGKRKSLPHLIDVQEDIALRKSGAPARTFPHDGSGVIIGVIDTGFDLSHPMFRDASGRLRVLGLMEQDGQGRQKEYDPAQLAKAWGPGGSKAGTDANGHGTHVASIAGGSAFQGREGVAPAARFLLVKTDFINTDKAARWIFDKAQAADQPCVINMSLGHHYGAHDGGSVEERLHEQLAGKGRIIVVSAGNERTDRIHIGGYFYPTQVETVSFDVLRTRDLSPPHAILSLWYDQSDGFDATLIGPTGERLDLPSIGSSEAYRSSLVEVQLSRARSGQNKMIQVEIDLSFRSADVPNPILMNWRLEITCKKATFGRLDGWFNNSGFAAFQPHVLVEEGRTVGICATGRACLAVASHVSRSSWVDNAGDTMADVKAVRSRSSRFSSLGPTRDGRAKPDVSAPGEFVTAALAYGSALERWEERAEVADRLVTIEGTSMSAPVVTGIVSLMLQANPRLDVDSIRAILGKTARRDQHTGSFDWNPYYGYGKVDAGAALASLPIPVVSGAAPSP